MSQVSSPLLSHIALVLIGALFLVAIITWIAVARTRYDIPKTPTQALTLEKLVPSLQDEANTLASKLQTRVKGYNVLSFVLVIIKMLGSLFFAAPGLNGQFEVSGGQGTKVTVAPLITTVFGVAILLAGSLQSRFPTSYEKRRVG